MTSSLRDPLLWAVMLLAQPLLLGSFAVAAEETAEPTISRLDDP